jgi:hypothetical protein
MDTTKRTTAEEALSCATLTGSVHVLTLEVLKLASKRDIVDAYFDVKFAADVLKERMDKALGNVVLV